MAKKKPQPTSLPADPETSAHPPIPDSTVSEVDLDIVTTADVSVVKAKPVGRKLKTWQWVLIGVLGLAAIAAVGFALTRPTKKTAVTNTVVTNVAPGDQLVPRRLDGVLVTPAAANTNIIAAMIENASDSRPPSGLDKASVVYEALAEGGITRFLALFPFGQSIPEIGPIRSARLYYVQWAEEYKPLYVHAGGSPQALSYLQGRDVNVIDFSQFRYGPNFIRDKTRRAPHNLYTSTDRLFLGLKKVAPDLVPSFISWTFKAEVPLEGRPSTVNDIVIDYSSFNYRVTYKYDRVLNQYQRFQGDTPHVTRDNSTINAKNIIVEFAKTRATGDDQKRLDVDAIGQGKILMFRDGTVTEGTWKKDSATDRTQWLDANDQPLALNPGSIWIEVIPTDRKVVY